MSRLPAIRDHAIDLVRALCIVGVVVLHALMVGVTVTVDGPVFANAGESGGWLTPVSWVLQVMPLFFVIGGFAGYTALTGMRERGTPAAVFVAERVRRLLLPATVVIAAAAAGLVVLRLAGVPEDLVAIAGYRFGQPLWFLGVFLLCQSLLPLLVRAHRARPYFTLMALGAGAVLVDAVRGATGIDAVGFLNLAFVWLTLQQLGLFLADGRIDALSRRARGWIGGLAVAALATAFTFGIHSPDLIANINPPTTALLLVGVAQVSAFSLLRRPVAALASRPAPAAFTRFVSRRAMTIYLWHMPVLLVLAGASALFAMGANVMLPVPASAQWWGTRPLWLLLALGITTLVAVPLSRFEAARAPHGDVRLGRVVVGAAIGVATVALLLAVGVSAWTAPLAVAALLLALAVAAPDRSEVQRMVQDAPRIEPRPASGTARRAEIRGDAQRPPADPAQHGLLVE